MKKKYIKYNSTLKDKYSHHYVVGGKGHVKIQMLVNLPL